MKILALVLVSLLNIFGAISSVTAQQKLTVDLFLDSLASDTKTLIDVRSAEEYGKGSLAGAQHIDWNDKTTFEQEIKKLDKAEPLYIFCLSGGRSAKASKFLQEQGFQVYELQGGFMQVPKELRVVSGKTSQTIAKKALLMADFKQLIASADKVLVDYTADWCIPCQELKPLLQKIDQDKNIPVKVAYLDADQNSALLQELDVTAIPRLQLYRAGELLWDHTGAIDEEELMNILQAN